MPAHAPAAAPGWGTGSPATFAQAAVQDAPRPPDVTCASCVVVDDMGNVLFARRATARRANASTTKMVTALVAVAAARGREKVTVSPTAASIGRGGVDLQAGDRFSVKELLYALLMSSSNDSAVALAEHVAGSERAFVARMNGLTRALGARDTKSVTAHGLDMPGHYSTARDLATIGAELLERPLLARIVATSEKVVQGSGGPEVVENRNLLLETYKGAIGIKTGFTAQAGNVLVAAARRRHRTVIAVAMGSVDATADAAELLDYGFKRLAQTVLLRAGQTVGAVVWPSGRATPIVSASTVRGLADNARVNLSFVPRRPRAVVAGDPVGTIVVRAGRRRIAAVDAVAGDDVAPERPSWVADVLAAIVRAGAAVSGRL